MSLCAHRASAAAPGQPTTPSAAAAPERLTRDDVDRILREAQAAIKQGNLEQADALVRRAERTGMHYQFMHLGPTPASVRRELTKAQKTRGPVQKTAAADSAAERTSLATAAAESRTPSGRSDPFLQSGTSTAPNTAPPPEPLPAARADGSISEPAMPGGRYASEAPPAGRAVANPFSPAATSSYSSGKSGEAGEAVVQTGYGTGPALAAPSRYATTPSNDVWTLPEAPLPSNSNASNAARPAASQASPAPASRQMAETNPATSAKSRTLSLLAEARQALDAGNAELAAKLAREASALGVPESQFLPHEDRPSLVAGDIFRAEQAGRAQPGRQGATRAGLNISASAPRYAEQAGSANNPISQPPLRSVQTSASAANESRLSLTPDPLELPMETGAPLAERMPRSTIPPLSDAANLLREGEDALRRHDRQAAKEKFSQAHILRDELAPADQQRLRDHLQMLAAQPGEAATPSPMPRRLAATERAPLTAPHQALIAPGESQVNPGGAPIAPPGSARSFGADDSALETDALPLPNGGQIRRTIPGDPSLIDSAEAQGQVLARQLQAEVGRSQTEARRLREQDPQQALEIIKTARQKVADAQITDEVRNLLLRRLDVTRDQTEQYLEEHRAEIEHDQKNKAVMAEVDRGRELKLKVQQKTAELVDEFNRLRDEQRYPEMEVVARRLYEMAPDDVVAQQVWLQSKFIRRTIMNRDLADRKENSVFQQLYAADASAVNPVAEDGKELVIDPKYWNQFVKDRKGSSDVNARRSERELDIEHRLETPVRLHYQNTPLSQVVDELSQLAGINIHLDPRGLGQEGIESDTQVTINLNSDISLKSALRLVLAPLHLSYVIKDEVLQITSEQISKGELVRRTYNVADLVIPIPNFVPSSNIGLQGLINDAYATSGRAQNGLGTGPAVLVGERGGGYRGAAGANDDVLANQVAGGVPGFGPTRGSLAPTTVPIGNGPGGLGGGAAADFDSLIDLITATVEPETWAEQGGGTAEVRAFPTNLSLVISQTQAVHQEIADLLEQLRRLQDLQVTIEVRFIRLRDAFFERIGIDFDANIEDRTIGTADLVPGTPFEPERLTATVGLNTPTGVNDFPRFTSDLDIPFRQEHFDLTRTTPFGGSTSVATMGFAILSDIEAYFLIEAAQGDARTNVLNAPKVTLFNGQQAFVTDSTQVPFVVGVIPVVGEFVAAQQPVIVVLNEGTMMTIQAVVSDDRRYVRLTVVPYFTQIGDVDEFTFEGSSSSTSSSSTTDDDNNGKNEKNDKSDEQTRTGVTVQLPSFSQISVVTTVSVPDGGTVLLGGIKRLSEGRNEFGVPLLSKLPYINRLFKNVAIGRETDSLMMMVTPRIIIQEEEEERLGIVTP
jgi:general secretion pathway protein D